MSEEYQGPERRECPACKWLQRDISFLLSSHNKTNKMVIGALVFGLIAAAGSIVYLLK